jgi:hypothetical protein
VTNYEPTPLNRLKAELNPICHLLPLLGAHHILHVSRIRVNCPEERRPQLHPREASNLETRRFIKVRIALFWDVTV